MDEGEEGMGDEHGDIESVSNEEEEFRFESDGDDDFGSDEDADDDVAIELENRFFDAEDRRTTEPEKAVELYLSVVALEKARRGDVVRWRFKALRGAASLLLAAGRIEEAEEAVKELLSCVSSVTPNEAAEAIRSLLEAANDSSASLCSAAATLLSDGDSRCAAVTPKRERRSDDGEAPVREKDEISKEQGGIADEATRRLARIYALTLQQLKASSNRRLWLTTLLRLGRLYLSRGAFEEVESLLHEVYTDYLGVPIQEVDGGLPEVGTSLDDKEGDEDERKSASRKERKRWGLADSISCLPIPDVSFRVSGGAAEESALLEIMALDIQLCTATSNLRRLRLLLPRASAATASVAEPGAILIVHEAEGRLQLRDKKWKAAQSSFFNAFRAAQEGGNLGKARQVVVCLALSSLLSASSINPFDSPEARAFASDPAVAAVRRLRDAYERNDVITVQRLLEGEVAAALPNEDYFSCATKTVANSARLRALEELVAPFRCVKLEWLQRRLAVDRKELRRLLLELFLSGRLKSGRIDDCRDVLYLLGACNATKSTTCCRVGLRDDAEDDRSGSSSLIDKSNTLQMVPNTTASARCSEGAASSVAEKIAVERDRSSARKRGDDESCGQLTAHACVAPRDAWMRGREEKRQRLLLNWADVLLELQMAFGTSSAKNKTTRFVETGQDGDVVPC